MKIAEREARAGRRSTETKRSVEDVHTVEDLNPKGRLVKDIEMSVRSAQAMAKLVEIVLTMHRGDIYETRNSDPRYYVGSNDKRTTGMSGLMADAEAGLWRRVPWSEWVDLTLTGGLRRQTEDLAGSLPISVRNKYIDGK